MKYLPLIWAGLWRRKLRTCLTLASIAIAFLLFGLLQGVNAAFSNSIAGSHLDRLYVQSRISFIESLPLGQLTQIEAVPGVTRVAWANWFGGYYQEPKNFIFTFAVVPDRYFAIFPELGLAPDQLEAFLHTRTGAVIGIDLAQKYGWKIGDHVPIKSNIFLRKDGAPEWGLDIVGIYDDKDDPTQNANLMLRWDYFDEARTFGHGTVGWYIAKIVSPDQGPAVSAAIDRLFANSTDETRTQSEKENTQSFIKQIGDINFIASTIVGAVFFTLLILTGNTMAQSVRERIPEFAVLKTLGFSDIGVLTLVVAEAVCLCLTAALIGLALAALAFPNLKAFVGIATLPVEVVGWGLLGSVFLALLTAALPAARVSRLRIVDALAGR